MYETNVQSTESICQSLIERGWAIVDSPIVGADQITECYAHWKRFFQSDSRFKFARGDGELDGFFRYGSETALGYRSPDPKEFFHFYPDGRCPENLRAESQHIFVSLSELGEKVLSELALFVPQISFLISYTKSSRNLVLRVAYYPSNTSARYFAAPHTDVNLLTILPRPTRPGLSIVEDGAQPVGVDCGENQFVVMVGDMMEKASKGKIKACKHFVCPSSADRLSFSFFLNPADETPLTESVTAVQFLRKRLMEIGLSER